MTQLRVPAPRRRPKYPRMTYEEFLRWDGENQHVEWVNGKVIPMAGVTGEHNEISGFLIALLGILAHDRGLGVLRTRPFQMKTGPDLPGRSPDLMFVSKRNRRRLHTTFLEGPADLVVEITCRETLPGDIEDKLREYEQGGVREFWLIDSERRRAEFYRRGRDGRFRLVPVGEDGVFRSAVIKGLWLKVEWLWQQPPEMDVLKEWALV